MAVTGDGHSDGSGSGSHENLADAAVAAAMRYRVGGPLIDGLMAELGMSGASLNGLLTGSGSAKTNASAIRKAAETLPAEARAKITNGSGDDRNAVPS